MWVAGHKIINDMSTSLPAVGSETCTTSNRLVLTYDQQMDVRSSAQYPCMGTEAAPAEVLSLKSLPSSLTSSSLCFLDTHCHRLSVTLQPVMRKNKLGCLGGTLPPQFTVGEAT